MRLSRIPVPPELAARVLFVSDRICCVCRIAKKPVQIHHIDENNSNNVFENLAVLCFDCHTETQIKGGFGRKLDAPQVKLYRDEWLEKVGRYELTLRSSATSSSNASPPYVDDNRSTDIAAQEVEDNIEHLEEIDHLAELAIDYHHSDDMESRDKCIEKILLFRDVPLDTELFFRSLQGKVNLVDRNKIAKQFEEWRRKSAWSELARAHKHLGQSEEAAKYYCLTSAKAMDEDNMFMAGYYLKEMVEDNLIVHLFERALQQAKEKDEFWWQIRSLQELDRWDEIDDLVLRNSSLIERRGRPHEIEVLVSARERQVASKGTRQMK